MDLGKVVGNESTSPASIARDFVEARRRAIALPGFPGLLPETLEGAYACQEAAIRLWPDQVAGWKIGRVPPELEPALGEMRLSGPIFAARVLDARLPPEPTPFPIFVGGFAAVEAELVFEIGEDAPAGKTAWTNAEALAIAGDLRMGVELAGSPLATINALGPTAVVSDFGNNSGLILGDPVERWRDMSPEQLVAETSIGGARVGRGGGDGLPGGPIGALRWLLQHCARRGRPLKRGQLVSTGALTGIHEIRAGQTAEVRFDALGSLRCVAVPAEPHDSPRDRRRHPEAAE